MKTRHEGVNERETIHSCVPHTNTNKQRMENNLKIIISGGGTGGHIFPAVAIANALKAKRPDAQILFVGALGRMEMQRVPAAGYEIKGLPPRPTVEP